MLTKFAREFDNPVFISPQTVSTLAPTPQNGQTHSNNSLATADELFECI